MSELGRCEDPGGAGALAAPRAYWSRTAAAVAAALSTGLAGLTSGEAARRRVIAGPNEFYPHRARRPPRRSAGAVPWCVRVLGFARCGDQATLVEEGLH